MNADDTHIALEQAVMAKLLAGDEPVLEALRTQYDLAQSRPSACFPALALSPISKCLKMSRPWTQRACSFCLMSPLILNSAHRRLPDFMRKSKMGV